MKKKLLSAMMVCALSASAVAHDDTTGHGYVGVKAGTGVGSIDTENVLGFVLGYDFGSTLSVEFEHANSEANSSVDITSNALYLAFRTEGDTYFKARGGFLHEKVERNYGWRNDSSDSDSGLSLGLGVGHRFNQLSLELEYTLIEQDVSYLTVGAQLHF